METNRERAPTSMKLTPEEQQALRECQSESFWYRAVPFSIIFGVGAQARARARPTASGLGPFGTLPKVLAWMLGGYILGKASYWPECQRKIMKLENSPMADAMRKRMSGYKTDQANQGIVYNQTTAQRKDQYYPEKVNLNEDFASSRIDKDTEVPNLKGLDDSFRQQDIDTERQIPKGLDDTLRPHDSDNLDKKQKTYTTYDELRGRNRDQYRRQVEVAEAERARHLQRPTRAPEEYKPRVHVKRNQYGDIIED